MATSNYDTVWYCTASKMAGLIRGIQKYAPAP